MAEDGVCQVAIKVARHSLTIRAACIQEFCISPKRIGDDVLVMKARFSAVPSAIDANPTTFDRHLFACNVFCFRDHGCNLEIVLCETLKLLPMSRIGSPASRRLIASACW